MIITPLAPGDRPVLETILAEIQASAHGTSRPASSYAEVARELIEDGYTDTVLARDGDTALGLAIFTFLQPTDQTGGTLHLKELFVRDNARRLGVGTALMRHVAGRAHDRGCVRFEWATGRSNARAIAFYRDLGAQPLEDRVLFRMGPDQIADLARHRD